MCVATKIILRTTFVVGLAANVNGNSRAQQPKARDTQLTFEVATIRPIRDPAGHENIDISPGGRFRATLSVKHLIERAYGLRDFQILGGPKWLDSTYEIVAKADENDDPNKLTAEEGDQLYKREMQRMQALLADRFRFRSHQDTRSQPVYALVRGRRSLRLDAPKAGETHRLYQQGPGDLACFSTNMAEFADELNEIIVGRKVVDQTGLSGRFDFHIKWTPDALLEGRTGGDPQGPTLFTALDEQLGLKLQSARASVDLLVIDNIDKPSEN